jgi:2-polyprenyl-6-methoxyphenol hydroxylase-like FAD-dependent oxidoreductase
MAIERVAVIGAGMAGMAAALALTRTGRQVTLLEKFATPRPLGAGLLLQPTGQAALAALGLFEPVAAKAARVDSLIGRTPAGGTVLRIDYARLRPDAFGLGVHRGVLFEALYGAVYAAPIERVLDFDAARIEMPAGSIHTACGASRGPFDLILVADGAHSHLRDTIMGPTAAPVYPWGALWTIVPDPDQACAGILRQVYAGARVMIGLLPVGVGADGGGHDAALFWSLPARSEPAWRAAGLNAWIDDIRRYWPEAGDFAARISSPDRVAFATYRDVRMKPWRKDKVVFLGDAAHGTSPQLGQGANLALVDGLTIAAAVEAHPSDLEAALFAYEQSRRGLVGWTQFMSRWLSPAFQSGVPGMGVLRNLTLPIARAIPPLEQLMLRTLTGAQATPFSSAPVVPETAIMAVPSATQ